MSEYEEGADPEKVEKAAKATKGMFSSLIEAAVMGIPQLTAIFEGIKSFTNNTLAIYLNATSLF